MGQYGARGMASAGRTFTEIVKHYYSGITLTTRSVEDIRVLVEESADVIMTSQAPFTASWAAGGMIFTTDATWKFVRVRISGSTYSIDRAASSGGPWTGVSSGTSYVVFSPGSARLELVFDSGKVRLYDGQMIARVGGADAKMRAINQLLLEDYLKGVVPREMPASWPAEALKAQSVAARSYSVHKKNSARANGTMFDICATTSCQVYGGAGWRSSPGATFNNDQNSATNAAIAATARQVAVYGSSPILAEYSSSTGGYTAPGSVAYEKAVPDPGDAGSPHHNWTASVRVSEIEARWPSIGRLVAVQVTKRNGYGDWGGRVTELRLTGTSANVTMSGHAFRGAFAWPDRSSGVRSDWFNVRSLVPGGVGVRRDNTWFLRTDTGTIGFAWGRATDRPVVGDWDGNGTDTVGVVRGNIWFLDNNNDGHTDRTVSWGRSTDRPVVGDWDGDGDDTPGLVRGNVWYLDVDGNGRTDRVVTWGRSTDVPVAGDWDGNRTDTPGLVRGGQWFLDNGFDGHADIAFPFGRPTDRPVVGDWNRNGTDTAGVTRGNLWFLDNANDGSGADVSFSFGRSTDVPLVGDWMGVSP